MMHHAVHQVTVAPRGIALCGATLHPPEVKSCSIIWCVIQRAHIVENCCDFLVLSASKDFLVCNLYTILKSYCTSYCVFYKDILHFWNPNTAPKNKINNWRKKKKWIFTWYPGARFMSSHLKVSESTEISSHFCSNLPCTCPTSSLGHTAPICWQGRCACCVHTSASTQLYLHGTKNWKHRYYLTLVQPQMIISICLFGL